MNAHFGIHEDTEITDISYKDHQDKNGACRNTRHPTKSMNRGERIRTSGSWSRTIDQRLLYILAVDTPVVRSYELLRVIKHFARERAGS